jgi:hypothetical protein
MGHPEIAGGASLSQMRRLSRLAQRVAAFVMALLLVTGGANAHEVNPSIADVTVTPERVEIVATVSVEAWLAGVDLASVTDTNASPRADEYDRLRALPPAEIEALVQAEWNRLATGFRIAVGDTALVPALVTVGVADAEDASLPRQTRLVVVADLPPDDTPVTVGWVAQYGPLILRQQGAVLAEGQDPYSAFLDGGAVSTPMPRTGAAQDTALTSFAKYVWTGFQHILPKGLDHILFVLGLFFFSLHLRPLLYQVTAFTAAHTLTLALATLDIVSVPASIVEPLIALSIAYVAVENIFHRRINRLRVAVVFGFGLLHGLGFASVLGDIGLSPGHFLASLIAFNIGVELGQLAVILVAFLTVGLWFGKRPWYRARIAVPASAGIAVMGLWWFIERTFL